MKNELISFIGEIPKRGAQTVASVKKAMGMDNKVSGLKIKSDLLITTKNLNFIPKTTI